MNAIVFLLAAVVTVTEPISTDAPWPGAQPFRGAKSIAVRTAPAARGEAKLVVREAKDRDGKPDTRFEFAATFDGEGAATFKTDLDPSKKYQYERLAMPSMPREEAKGIAVSSAVAQIETSEAEALALDVEGGDFMHVIHSPSESQTLVLKNPADRALTWRGKVTFAEYFGLRHELPVEVTLATNETRRIPLSFDFSRKGVWRVRGEFTAGDGTKCVRLTRFAHLDRHEVTPKLAKPKFRMGFVYHVEWLPDRHREKTRLALVNCGAKIARIGTIAFLDRERKKGVFNWERSDMIIGELERAGIACHCGVYGTPAWARDPAFVKIAEKVGWNRCVFVPSRPGTFREYCKAAAARYGTRIDYYECGNEWDLISPEILPIDKALLMQKECYEGLKAGCPDVCVTPNGWTLPDSDSWLGRTATNPGINEAFGEKAQGWYDVHPIHLHCDFELYEKFIQERQFPFMKRYHIDKPWLAGETALNSQNGTEDRTAQHLWKKILYSWAWGSTDYIWYNLRAKGWDETNSETAYGVVRADYRPLATYAAFSALTAALEGMDFDRRIVDRKSRHVYAFKGENLNGLRGMVIAGWDTSGKTAHDWKTDATRAWTCDVMGNRAPLALADGKVTWQMGGAPTLLVLEGASRAEAADMARLQDVPDMPMRTRTITRNGTLSGRGQDFTSDAFWQVTEYYKADPDKQHRCWRGIKDKAAKVWLTALDAALRFRVTVEDDRHVETGDVVKVSLKAGASCWIGEFKATRRAGTETTYEFDIPFAEAKLTERALKDGVILEMKFMEDDGEGCDGYNFIRQTLIKTRPTATPNAPRQTTKPSGRLSRVFGATRSSRRGDSVESSGRLGRVVGGI